MNSSVNKRSVFLGAMRKLMDKWEEDAISAALADAPNDNAERFLWLVHTANREEIEATLLSGKQPHEIIELIDGMRP